MTLDIERIKARSKQNKQRGRGLPETTAPTLATQDKIRKQKFADMVDFPLSSFMASLAVRIEMSRLDSHAVIYLLTKKKHALHCPTPVWLRDHAGGKEESISTRG